jgi:hypothetical protein
MRTAQTLAVIPNLNLCGWTTFPAIATLQWRARLEGPMCRECVRDAVQGACGYFAADGYMAHLDSASGHAIVGMPMAGRSGVAAASPPPCRSV